MFILFGYSSSIQLYFKIINFSVKPESLTCTYALKGTIYILTIYNNFFKKSAHITNKNKSLYITRPINQGLCDTKHRQLKVTPVKSHIKVISKLIHNSQFQ